ncbi:tumor necrosis factor receptor superfamily member 13B [Tachyglossus aculeatus]|uniref:tumor necrosis factor receptor superfamily member 13B n=1 Tax=Tachyglossus aculeatus TaxID=9261 RepID=UPI0018F5FB09|nr:tumor necrosis factor receptor superfamily member 13B [Tachyglossus aculeatus]
MGACPEEEYWDTLLRCCVPCRSICNRPNPKSCATFCESLKCHRQHGVYYDTLLKQCIKCSATCGQHPLQCAPFCQSTPTGQKRARWSHELPANFAAPSSLEQKLRGEASQLVLVYSILGLCLCAVVCCFLIMVTCFLKRKGGELSCQPPSVKCHTRGGSSKDHLMEAGSDKAGSGEGRSPEPIETCSFCFPEQRPAKESAANNGTFHPQGKRAAANGVGVAGTVSSLQDGCLKIICSPSQEKMTTT